MKPYNEDMGHVDLTLNLLCVPRSEAGDQPLPNVAPSEGWVFLPFAPLGEQRGSFQLMP